MQNRYLVLLFSLFITLSYSQDFKVTGTLIDQDTQQPLEAATVFMETVKDSTLITYTITNKNGAFTLEGKNAVKDVQVNISFVGYATYEKKIDLSTSQQNLGTISIAPSVAELGEVLLKSRAPVTIKKDTLEFNVASFKTKKDANIEDLLRELPGVEVDAEGKIKVNGKDVSKILVNGKPFFGDDPTIATRNLTKEIVEKIQVTDTKTESEAFSGEEGDQENKTINLTIKEENNKGVFGRVAAGGGTDKRYEFAGLFNYFDNDRRLSFLGGGNNTNSPGFSFGEISRMFSGNSRSFNSNGSFSIGGRNFGGGEGIVTSRNGGVSYADVIKEGVDVSADYFYSGSNSNNESVTRRENILPDRRYFTNSNSSSNNNTDNHSANMAFNIKLDSTFLINIRPAFNVLNSKDRYQSASNSTDEDGTLTNSSNQFSQSETVGRNFNNDLDLTKRFGDKGGFIKYNMTNEFSKNEVDDYLQSETLIFGDSLSTINRDQFTDETQDFTSFYGQFTYRQPLIAKKFFLDFKYSYRIDKTDNIESTFDFNESSGTYSDFNTELSTNYRFVNERSTPGLGLSYQSEKFRFNVGGGYVLRTLENKDALRPNLDLKETYKAIELNANGNYQFTQQMFLYAGYNLNNSPPQVSQLQPNPNVQDPLNTITGNPALQPANNHNVYASFNNYNFQKGTGFYFYFNGYIQNNSIVSKTIVDENNIRNTTFANVDGRYGLNGGGNLNRSIKIDSIRSIKYNGGVWMNINRDISFNNNEEFEIDNNSITPNLGLTFSWNKVLELRARYSISFSTTSYENDIFEANKFENHNVSLFSAFYLPKHFEWSNDINYSYNPDITPGFEKSAWFWNTSLAYNFLKEKATVSFKVYDLLNQNTNARRSATENYIQDTQSTVLQQYFMLTFSYKFNSLGSKGETGNGDVFMMH
jgi:hypothetical protein